MVVIVMVIIVMVFVMMMKAILKSMVMVRTWWGEVVNRSRYLVDRLSLWVVYKVHPFLLLHSTKQLPGLELRPAPIVSADFKLPESADFLSGRIKLARMVSPMPC